MQPSTHPRGPLAERLWWLYVSFGILCLLWAGLRVTGSRPGWGVEVALFGLIGLCNVAVGLIWFGLRRRRRRVGR